MAKKSMINRELKRTLTVAKYAVKRAALKAIIANPESSGAGKLRLHCKSNHVTPVLHVSVTAAVLQVVHMVCIASSA